MEKTKESSQSRNSIKGLASSLLEEVIIADMSMHEAQIEAWKKFAEHRPHGERVNQDIHLGFSEKRYLCLNELRFSFHIKSMPLKFLNRIKLALKVLSGKSNLALYEPVVFDFCSAQHKNAMPMEILVRRFENGNLQAEYRPVDMVTKELLKTS